MKRLLPILLLNLITVHSFSQKVDKSKSELNSGSKTNSSSSNTNSSSTSSKSSNNDSFDGGGFFVELGFYIGFYSTIGDYRNEDHLYNFLSNYPYFDGESGNYVESFDSLVAVKKMRLDLENHFLYNSKTYGNHFKAKFRPSQYFYIQGSYRELIEKNSFNNSNSNLSIFQFNVAYDRLRFEKFNLGWTLGATYIGSGVNKAGFSYGLNTDIFLLKKMSITSAMIWSRINGLPVNSFELKGKYHKKNYFYTVGFENLKIATPTYNFITFGIGLYL